MRSPSQNGQSIGSNESTFNKRVAWLDKHGLSNRQRIFVLSYLETCNATAAAEIAQYANPKSQGSRLLTYVSVQAALQEGRDEIEATIMVRAEDITRMWWVLANCDVNELVQNVHCACRYCYGIGYEYQWKTKREFKQAFVDACYGHFADPELRDKALSGSIQDDRLPSDVGGYGYRVTDDPSPDCPECSGLGLEHVRMADTRNLSPAARMLYNGVEVTQNGKKIKIASREAALERLAKHLGMFAGKVEDETTSSLTRLVQRLSESAMAVPVRAGPPEQVLSNIADNTPPQILRGE
jgi:hypothetical protein